MSAIASKPAIVATTTRCAHCSLPVPPSLVEADGPSFCCAGCKAVWHTLHACGLERYYELVARESGPRASKPATVTHRRFAHFDRPEFLAQHATPCGERRLAGELLIDGLHCGACVWLLEALPRLIDGLFVVRIDMGAHTARVEWDPQRTSLGEIARRCDRLGYQLLPSSDRDTRQRDRAIDRAWLVRIGVAAMLASNSMALAFALYSGLLSPMSATYRLFFQWLSVAIVLVALAIPGRLYFVNALMALRTRVPHMDVPIAVGLLGAAASGIINTIRGVGSIYCESATMLVFLLLVGRFVQYRSQRRARREVELITSLVPAVARRCGADGSIEEVPNETLVAGDVVEVTAGDAVPCDGRLLGDPARFDLSLLTGESRPVAVSAGASVWAGTRVIDRPVRIVVDAVGAATRAGRLLAFVSEAAQRRPPLVEMANRLAGWFLVAVLACAAFTTWWWWHLGADEAIGRAVALLVVTCPCALGLATPLAIVAGLGKAARRGVLVKGGEVLERLARPGTIVLDKTGTLTHGRVAVNGASGDVGLLRAAAVLERSSVHPIARAIVDRFAPDPAQRAANVREHVGRGIEGDIDGAAVMIGNESFMREREIWIPPRERVAAQAAAERGETPVFVARNGTLRGLLTVGDPVREDARATLAALRALGWRAVMCTGDHVDVARAVGRLVGLDDSAIEGGCPPERKVEFVRGSGFAAPLVMVGDGVNDVAAMAAADVGVAVREGAQSALHVADVCLAEAGLRPIVRLLTGARRTVRAIKLMLGVSVAYNVAGAVLAFLGLVNPIVAAILMPVSSLTVLGLALWLPRFDGLEETAP